MAAFKAISNSIKSYSEAKINLGPMTDVVYAVNGGLEDWAYGGGWDLKGLSNCSDYNFQNSEGLKQVLFLAETDFNRNPPASRYGLKKDVLSGKGLVPEYIRMSLSVIDFAEPYILYSVIPTKDGSLVE